MLSCWDARQWARRSSVNGSVPVEGDCPKKASAVGDVNMATHCRMHKMNEPSTFSQHRVHQHISPIWSRLGNKMYLETICGCATRRKRDKSSQIRIISIFFYLHFLLLHKKKTQLLLSDNRTAKPEHLQRFRTTTNSLIQSGFASFWTANGGIWSSLNTQHHKRQFLPSQGAFLPGMFCTVPTPHLPTTNYSFKYSIGH